MIIYLTTNNIKGKVYVGKYCGKSESYLGSGTYIRRAIKKYGRENFSRITLEDGITDHDYLCEREKYWIAFYDSTNPEIGYNLTEGGKGTFGCHPSEETLEKMSKANKGENNPMFGRKGKDNPRFNTHHTDEACKKMSENHADFSGKNHYLFGKHPSEETCKKMSESAKSKPPITDETRRKMAESKKDEKNHNFGKHFSEETCKKMSENHWDSSGRNNPMWGKHHSDKTCEKISESLKGKNNPKTIGKKTILKALKLLEKGISVTKISKEVGISKNTVYKIKKGGYDNIYDLPKKTK